MITRRQVLQASGTFAGHALAVDKAFAQVIIYPGAGHGFHADYRPSYNAAAATDGWKRCVGWFNKYVKG